MPCRFIASESQRIVDGGIEMSPSLPRLAALALHTAAATGVEAGRGGASWSEGTFSVEDARAVP